MLSGRSIRSASTKCLVAYSAIDALSLQNESAAYGKYGALLPHSDLCTYGAKLKSKLFDKQAQSLLYPNPKNNPLLS